MDAADIRKRMRTHVIAFGAILILALIGAGSAFADIANAYLLIAIVAAQVTIVLTALMHARADGPWVRGTLFFAALFVAVLIGLTALGLRSTIDGTEHLGGAAPAESAAEEAH